MARLAVFAVLALVACAQAQIGLGLGGGLLGGGIGLGGLGGIGHLGGIGIGHGIGLHSIPNYAYNYAVSDKLTGDNKQQSEVRKGAVTVNQYSQSIPHPY